MDKPIVLLDDIDEIASLFFSEPVNECKRLGGVPNVTFRIGAGLDFFALRICNNGYTSPEHLEAEVSVLDYLECTGFDVSPRIKRGLNGNAIQRWRDYRVIAMNFIQGISADRTNVSLAICEQVGLQVAKLRSALAFYPGSMPGSETFESRTRRLLNALPSSAAEMGWSIPIAKIVAAFDDSLYTFQRYSLWPPTNVVHTDVWPPNVLLDRDIVAGIVDFDDMAIAPPILDLSAVLAEFALTADGEPRLAEAKAIFDGYRSIIGSISGAELKCLVAGIKASCAGWLACNALHRVPFDDSASYLKRIQHLSSPGAEMHLETMFAAL